MARTAARVDMAISNNATWQDGFMFGVPGDTSWSFVGMNFNVDIKGNRTDPTPLLSLSSVTNQILVADAVNRILYFNVDDATIQSALNPGDYVYDLIMYDTSSPPIRVELMEGKICVGQGVTQS